MVPVILEELRSEVGLLRTVLSDMEARGDRVPLEAEEKLHAIEELLSELASALATPPASDGRAIERTGEPH